MHRLLHRSSRAALWLTTAALPSGAVAAQLGHIDFPTSAQQPAAQAAFEEGVLLLHSFEYEDARTAFRRAGKLEPGLAMATWGEALTFYHPIWRREEPDLARAALAELGASPAERQAAAGTDLERGWLATVEALFGDGPRNARWTAYAERLAALQARYPHDVEIGAMRGLAILGTSFGRRDPRIYMRAAGVLQPLYHRHPDHPGLLHYLIHCYDDPVHAPLGLAMAQRYDRIAPDAGHALHMPSHIYVALGRWQDSILANEASFAAGDRRRERKGLGVDDRNWHACQWLAYSYLQRGRAADAAALLDQVRRDHGEDPTQRLRFHLIVMRAAHLVETDAWPGDYGVLEVAHDGLLPSTIATDHFARAMSALARGQTDDARTSLETVRRLAPMQLALDALASSTASCCAPSGQRAETAEDQLAARVVTHQIEAALAAREGDTARTLAHLREACATEDAMDLDFGPPLVAKPAHEALGEMLLAHGEAREALEHFERALVRAPGRARSLLGLGRARRALGDDAGATAVLARLAAIWRDADADWPGLAEVRAAAARR